MWVSRINLHIEVVLGDEGNKKLSVTKAVQGVRPFRALNDAIAYAVIEILNDEDVRTYLGG
jgi:hypothetical protein